MHDLPVELIDNFNVQESSPPTWPTAEYQKDHCIDSDMSTVCKSAQEDNIKSPAAIKLKLRGSSDHAIKSVTIYSPIDDDSYDPADRIIKVKTKIRDAIKVTYRFLGACY